MISNFLFLLMLQKMLRFDMRKRVNAAEALKHAYFQEYEQYPPVFADSSSSTLATRPELTSEAKLGCGRAMVEKEKEASTTF